MDKISVIVPAYNAEKTIGKCLETLVNQTYDNMEIIVIDDGSKDGTLKILKDYQKKYPNKFIIISRENKGIGYTRNEGIKKATGKYLGFIDSDDYVELEMYEHLLEHMRKTKSDIVVCDYYQFDENKRIIKKVTDFEPTTLLNSPNLINEINTAPWNKLYKKEIFDDIEYPENLKYEDLSTVLFALLKANKIAKLNEPLVDYYINMNGETQTYNYKIFDIFDVLQMIIDNFPKEHKKINKEIFSLACIRINYYVASLLDYNDREMVLRFYEQSVTFMNKNFKNWRLRFIKSSQNAKEFIIRIMRTNSWLYKIFIKHKIKKTKKKVLFTNYYLGIGGIEKALINMVNNMDFSKYDITILLQHKKGEFLNDVDRRVNIQGFNLSDSKFTLYRKAINLFKIYITIIKNYKKYDFAACYGPSHKVSAVAALKSSKNNAIWMHTNIVEHIKNEYNIADNTELNKKLKKFLNKIGFRKFKNNLFVSSNSLESYLSIFPEDQKKCHLCYNFIDYNKIISMSQKPINIKKDNTKFTFINIGRHSEYEKRISRIITAAESLKKNYNFIIYLVGNGTDHEKYQNMVKEKKLEKYIQFVGAQANPYPYYLLADAFVLSSAFEGFPTVYTESLVLNVPVITTDVSDAKKFINKNYGIVCENNTESLIKTLKKFMDKVFIIKERFDPKKFNEKGMDIIERLIEDE